MSVVVLPSLGDYWRNHKDLHYQPVAGRITRERYQTISRYLHFVDNNTLASRGDSNYDRLGKVQPVLEGVNANFQAVYNPHREVTIGRGNDQVSRTIVTEAIQPNETHKKRYKILGPCRCTQWIFSYCEGTWKRQIIIYLYTCISY